MHSARRSRSYLAALLAVAGGCSVGPPHIGSMTGNVDGGATTSLADSVYSFIKGGVATNCVDGLPDCTTTFTQQGSCAGNPALSMGGNTWELQNGDNIVLGFRCTTLTEVGPVVAADGGLGPSPDFQIFGTATGPIYPVVEVSIDETNFYSAGQWKKENETNPTFDLEATMQASSTTMPLLAAKAVRISQIGNGSAQIDAVEALRAIK